MLFQNLLKCMFSHWFISVVISHPIIWFLKICKSVIAPSHHSLKVRQAARSLSAYVNECRRYGWICVLTAIPVSLGLWCDQGAIKVITSEARDLRLGGVTALPSQVGKSKVLQVKASYPTNLNCLSQNDKNNTSLSVCESFIWYSSRLVFFSWCALRTSWCFRVPCFSDEQECVSWKPSWTTTLVKG